MSLSTDNPFLASDMAAIISSINAETTRRSATGSAPAAPTQGSSFITSEIETSSISQIATVNAKHAYGACAVMTRLGGSSKTPTASAASFTQYSSTLNAANMNKVKTDIDTLVGQTLCTNTANSCANNPGCAANGGTNTSCGNCCNGQCACDTVTSRDHAPTCTCQSVTLCVNCCNGQCTCNGQCCNGQCCNSNCSCNTVCSCEFV